MSRKPDRVRSSVGDNVDDSRTKEKALKIPRDENVSTVSSVVSRFSDPKPELLRITR